MLNFSLYCHNLLYTIPKDKKNNKFGLNNLRFLNSYNFVKRNRMIFCLDSF